MRSRIFKKKAKVQDTVCHVTKKIHARTTFTYIPRLFAHALNQLLTQHTEDYG
jgi:hypothetical protein